MIMSNENCINFRGRSRATASSKMECFLILFNGFQPLTIITKRSILDVAAALGRMLWLEISTSNKIPEILIKHYLDAVKQYGMPVNVDVDDGM